MSTTKSKHRDRQFFIARGVFGLAGAILVALVVFIAVHAGGGAEPSRDAVLVQPSADLRAAAESSALPLVPESTTASVPASVPGSPSASPSASASASATPSKTSASPKPSKTSASPKPSVTKTTTAPAAKDLDVTYSTSANWNNGFIAALKVTNSGSQPHDFSITLSYPSGSGLAIRGAWNASASVNGNQIVVRGRSPLAGNSSITVGFQSDKRTNRQLRPTGCTVTGGSCKVS
ncbi:cellulose binding domain-containing protein [Actinoplanes siamensis]|uniref:CBM2 domain-containing protein n=1 Tax=Actinoplanes siamensis TaxID=1223317 RepID=A0A919NA61_9ACTN|nr:cellulose binding domain-containing protein [Actinoplanes siamensis]GIF07126.1 hypothetical protein Asi03nite_46640 [Actinoplanes siamensis]